jgi:hypothetical protein
VIVKLNFLYLGTISFLSLDLIVHGVEGVLFLFELHLFIANILDVVDELFAFAYELLFGLAFKLLADVVPE